MPDFDNNQREWTRSGPGQISSDATMVPDYYARLEVDPRADRAEIEAALQRKQPAWSMGTRNPKNRHTNQLYLDEIPALRRALLSDPASRAAYDAELAVAQRAEREAEARRAATAGPPPRRQGGTRGGRPRAPGRRGHSARPERGRPAPAHPADPEPRRGGERQWRRRLDIDPPADVLDPSTRRQIRVALEHLGCRDLYDALGLTRDAPASDIAARADAERQRWMKKAQVTAEKTAWLEVVAHAQSHLGSPRSRSRYDRTLGPRGRGSLRRPGRVRAQGARPARPGHPLGPRSPRRPRWGSPPIAPTA